MVCSQIKKVGPFKPASISSRNLVVEKSVLKPRLQAGEVAREANKKGTIPEKPRMRDQLWPGTKGARLYFSRKRTCGRKTGVKSREGNSVLYNRVG